MADDTEIQNKESILGNETNEDGSPVQEVLKDGEVIAEIQNKETIFGTVTNEDDSPVKEVVKKD
jgi:hypothetical protein